MHMKREIFVQLCMQFLNIPYRWGGDDPIKGYDCSGLVQELLAMIGIDPKGDQTAQGLYDHFNSTSDVNKLNMTTGSLCFYGESTSKISHVGMILDDDYMIEAGGGGSKTNSLDDAAAQNAYIRIRPFTTRRDLVAVLTPGNLPW